jgi:hypothetical protein
MNRYYKPLTIFFVCLAITAFYACNGSKPADEEAAIESQTPVTVTTIGNSALADTIELNATSSFLQTISGHRAVGL